jgi:hypothetical protein
MQVEHLDFVSFLTRDLPRERQPFAPSPAGLALRVPDVEAARAELETKGVRFDGDTIETSVCKQAWFKDPDGNSLMLHRRYDV